MIHHQEKELAVKRSQFLRNVKISVKCSEKTSDRDQLIMIETSNIQTKQNFEVVMRKLSQLDYLVQHINTEYGGHIIPFIKSDLYFQKNLQMKQLVPTIAQYLNDLKHNKYCRQDIKVYTFLMEQEMIFPQQQTYDKVLNSATNFSRKYLSSIFTRKQRPKQQNTNQYVTSLNIINQAISEYERVREISVIIVEDYCLYEQTISLFSQLSSEPTLAIPPKQQTISCIKAWILNCDKLILQTEEANNRWENLAQAVKEIQSNVYKGLHEYQHSYQEKKKHLKEWSKSLSEEFWQLSEYITGKMESISNAIQNLKKDFIKECSNIEQQN